MRAWLAKLWDDLRGGFWFIPAVMISAAILCAIGAFEIDRHVDLTQFPGLSGALLSPDAARSLLDTLAGALITTASVVVSVTLVTLSLTTTQFGSRLLRAISVRNTMQITFGMIVGASVYCLMILTTVRGGEEGAFVPQISVLIAVLLGVAAMVSLVIFLHRIMNEIQAQNLVRAVAQELDDTIERIFPPDELEDQSVNGHVRRRTMRAASDGAEPLSSPQDREETDRVRRERHLVVESTCEGYVTTIDVVTLATIAEEFGAEIAIDLEPGDFIVRSAPFASVRFRDGNFDADDEEGLRSFRRRVQNTLYAGAHRTPRQDIECALSELVEMAVRALSPGINDPFTARACIDYLGAAMTRLCGCATGDRSLRDEEGRLLVVIPRPSFSDVLDAAFDEIRQYGAESPATLARMIESLGIVAAAAQDDDRRQAVARHLDRVGRAVARNVQEPDDRSRLEDRLTWARARLTDSGLANLARLPGHNDDRDAAKGKVETGDAARASS